jgi:predicted Zn-dependent protease
LYYLEKDPRALPTARAASKLDDRNPHVMDTLGWILVENGQAAEGLPLLEKATESLRGAPEVRLHYATALARAGNKGLARRELEGLLKDNPRFARRAEAETLLRQL